MTNLKNFKWSPICINCKDCCYDYEIENDPWNLGVERIDENGKSITGVEFIKYLKSLGGEPAKRIKYLKLDEYGCIEVKIPPGKTYRDTINCIFLDENSNCVIHPTRINLNFDLRGKLCASYLCEIAEFVNKEMAFLKNHLDRIKEAQNKRYGDNSNLNLIQYLKKIPKNKLKQEICKILKLNHF
ncbi:MAG: hypothetical protein ACTSYZ_01060 [Candidatus Helarchaeota archaeon]